MAMKHQTLSKCIFSSKHINFPLLSPFYCWGVMSYLAIIQPIQPLGLVSSKVPKIKDNTLAKADSMAPAMLRRYKIHPFRKALRPRPGGCFVLNWLVVSTPLKNISQNGNLPQVGVKMKNIGNHHPVNPWLWKILEKFSARFMFFLRITAVLSGNNAIHPSDQRLEVSKFGNPMKRSHAEMATDMWEILGFKRALSIFPEPRHPRADETTPSRLN